MLRLECVVQPYAWGDTEAIPKLLGQQPTGEPAAELWMGAHPAAPSTHDGRSLAELIADDQAAMLGQDIAASFGELPFLAKILAAGQPLSIQSHPTLDDARSGFERENAAGVPLGTRERVYSDPNHKPELICALTPFDAKCGFRDLDRTRQLFEQLGGEELAPLREVLNVAGSASEVLEGALAWLLSLQPAQSAVLVDAAVAQCGAGDWSGSEFEPELNWTKQIAQQYPGDPGVLVALLLNHVQLQPGQALFLGAGNLHAYLRGVGVEIMANSNNVVRGGLTPKHIDVPELLSVVDASPIDVPIQTATGPSHTFDVPVKDFGLVRVEASATSQTASPVGPEVLFVTSGVARLKSLGGSEPLAMSQGQVVFVPASNGAYEISGDGVLWRATVG